MKKNSPVLLSSLLASLVGTSLASPSLCWAQPTPASAPAAVPGECDGIDFNNDGLFPDTLDLDDFLSVFSGGPCSSGNCNDIDFNNDCLYPDTKDIDDFREVFQGGSVICGHCTTQGWTRIPVGDPVYVDAVNGSEANDGTTPAKALRRLVSAGTEVRSGRANQIHILSDIDLDLETNGFAINFSGTPSQPVVILGAKPDGTRPRITRTRDGAAFNAQSGGGINHVWIVGLDLQGSFGKVPGDTTGIKLYAVGEDFLIENCAISGFEEGVCLQGIGTSYYRNARLRRNDISWNVPDGSGHSQGVYAELVEDLFLDENVIFHNGWQSRVPGARGEATIFNHGFYSHVTCRRVWTRSNIVVDNSATGLQLRANEQFSSFNLLLNNPRPLDAGHDSYPYPAVFVTGSFLGNTILGSQDITSLQWAGSGIGFGKSKNMLISGNLVAHGPTARYGAISTSRPSENMTITGNYYGDWRGPGFEPYEQSNMRPEDVVVELRNVPTLADYLRVHGVTFATGTEVEKFTELARANRKGIYDLRWSAGAVGAWLRSNMTVPTTDN